MKLIKKLLIIACLASLLTPTAAESARKASYDVTLLTDGSANTSYEDIDYDNIIKPKSIQIIKAI